MTAVFEPQYGGFCHFGRFGYWRIDDYTNHKTYRGFVTSRYYKKIAQLKTDRNPT